MITASRAGTVVPDRSPSVFWETVDARKKPATSLLKGNFLRLRDRRNSPRVCGLVGSARATCWIEYSLDILSLATIDKLERLAEWNDSFTSALEWDGTGVSCATCWNLCMIGVGQLAGWLMVIYISRSTSLLSSYTRVCSLVARTRTPDC